MVLNNKIFAKKSLGQHFLVNSGVQQKIVNSCDLSTEDIVVEIGPGRGAITKLLASRAGQLIAVEKDRALASLLGQEMKSASNVRIIQKDILDYSFSNAAPAVKIVGNLPYNIATPIIEKVIRERANCRGFYFMVQKEYADRLVAPPGSKTYGSLSCFVQYYAQAKLLFKISRGSFRPMPKIESAFCRMVFYDRPPHQAIDEGGLFALIQTAFCQRRKTLENALSSIIEKDKWKDLAVKLKLDPRKRAEQLPLSDFVALSNALQRST